MQTKQTAALLAILVCLAAGAYADVITIGTKPLQGKFEGFEKNQFLFRTRTGELLKEDRMRVRKLSLDAPLDARLVRSGAEQSEPARLVSYVGGRFTIEQKGKQSTVLGMRVERIIVRRARRRPGADGGDAGRAPVLDISPLEGRGDLTESQAAALRRYKAARREFDDYVAENSAVVAEMDRSHGRQREKLLNDLRLRKNAEQPLKRELERAEAALLNAVPRPWTPPPIPADAPPMPPTPPATEVPELAEGEVLLIDVSALAVTPGLTKAQDEALRRYEQARDRYMESQDDADRVTLKKAQADLVKAFPGLSLQ